MKKILHICSTSTLKNILFTGLFSGLFLHLPAQTSDSVFSKDATRPAQQKLYQNISRNIIQKNLRDSLSINNADAWATAFDAILLVNQKSAWIDQKISEAVSKSAAMPVYFQIKLIALLQGQHRYGFRENMEKNWANVKDTGLAAMTAWYLYCSDSGRQHMVASAFRNHPLYDSAKPMMRMVYKQMQAKPEMPDLNRIISAILSPYYLRGHTITFCLLPQNRDYPGLIVVRDSSGNWLRDDHQQINHVPVLARSISNMPGIFHLGNTPRGLYRMDGFGRSLSGMIGPSENVQMTMPYEYKAGHFFMDSSLQDNEWSLDMYKKLLPPEAEGYEPLHESFFAGQSGRTEIIIHGHTTNPLWYRDAAFWPMIPSNGCLTTKERWDETNGLRLESGQQELTNLIRKAGGPNGYLIVLDIPFRDKAMELADIIGYFKPVISR